jgi:hypothetical protein
MLEIFCNFFDFMIEIWNELVLKWKSLNLYMAKDWLNFFIAIK